MRVMGKLHTVLPAVTRTPWGPGASFQRAPGSSSRANSRHGPLG
jgi:hypothetical protein